jgi:hypothetical protein
VRVANARQLRLLEAYGILITNTDHHYAAAMGTGADADQSILVGGRI